MKKSKNLKDKRILIGVCGGVSIYKICTLIRLLKRNEAQVRIIMTESAKRLISPFLFESLAESSVHSLMFQSASPGKIEHIELAQWADIFIIAPATANTIGKLANGIADNLLTTVFLALQEKTPVLIVPAMESNMWENVFLQENIKKLKKRKNLKILPPKEGLLASGKVGKGRMAEPEEIFKVVKNLL